MHGPTECECHGELTLGDLIGGGLGELFAINIDGGAALRADAVVDFSTLGPDFAQLLPSISTKLLVDFGLKWSSSGGFEVDAPRVVFGDITLDLGSFISNFAGPILQKVKDVLDPLAWLIGPSGFLNMRIPLLSDLAGHTITGGDLVAFFDPTDGPALKEFLSFVLQLYHLVDLVQAASAGGEVKLNFGDIELAGGAIPASWTFFDSNLLGAGGGFSGPNANLANMSSLKGLTIPDSLPAPTMEGTEGSSTSEFTSGLSGSTAFDFPIIQHPSDLINLLFGKPVTLVEITLPELSFNFTYMQEFPIIGPLVGTFEGGIGAKLDLRLGYDTQGLTDFLASKDPASLLEGFFFDTKDAKGNTLPVATLNAEIAVGAALDLVLLKVGVEGGINCDRALQLGRPERRWQGPPRRAQGEHPRQRREPARSVRYHRRARPLPQGLRHDRPLHHVVHAQLQVPEDQALLLRRSVHEAVVPGDVSNGALTLAIGPSSANRIKGNLDDIAETIHVASNGGAGQVAVWSDQFGRGADNAQTFDGITSIVANGGAGDDIIDLSGLNDATITVVIHGGDGNDTIIGPKASKCSMNCGSSDPTKPEIFAQLYGDGGDDTLVDSSTQNDLLSGGDGQDTLYGRNADFSSPAMSGRRSRTTAPRRSKATAASTPSTAHPARRRSTAAPATTNRRRRRRGRSTSRSHAGSIQHITTTGPGTATLDESWPTARRCRSSSRWTATTSRS